MGIRTIIVGDVHGMLPELVALMDAVGLTRDDVLVSAGDLIDKGPESAGVVRYMRSLRDRGYNVVLCEGNHEEKHFRFRKAMKNTPGGAASIKMKGVDEMTAITAALSPEDIAFLDSAVMFHRMPEHNALVVHAGILPSMKVIPTQAEIAAMPKGDLEKLKRVLRVRHVTGKATSKVTVEFNFPFEVNHVQDAINDGRWTDFAEVKNTVRPKGSFVVLGEETEADPFWVDTYDGRFGRVFFGHSPFPEAAEPVQFPHAVGLDLGAVFGGRLACAVLEVGTKEPRFITVPSRGKFSSGYWEE